MSSVINPLVNAYQDAGEVSRLDKLGYIPLVGTVSGAIRIVCGVALTIISALAAVYSVIRYNSAGIWGLMAAAGLCHIVRGLVELMPIIGGILTHRFDKATKEDRQKMAVVTAFNTMCA